MSWSCCKGGHSTGLTVTATPFVRVRQFSLVPAWRVYGAACGGSRLCVKLTSDGRRDENNITSSFSLVGDSWYMCAVWTFVCMRVPHLTPVSDCTKHSCQHFKTSRFQSLLLSNPSFSDRSLFICKKNTNSEVVSHKETFPYKDIDLKTSWWPTWCGLSAH